MYKILVCDDEKWIRKGITAKIKNMQLPISEIFEAENAAEAYQIVEKNLPHIVVTDICMEEGSNGLDLIEEIADSYPDIRFIIISGYSEFAYAERAIRLGVAAYVLKPVDITELEGALKTAFAKYEQNKKNMQAAVMERMFQRERDNYQTEFEINQIFHAANTGETKRLSDKTAAFREFNGSFCRGMILQIEDSSYDLSGFSSGETELIKYGIENIVVELSQIYEFDTLVLRDLNYTFRMIIIMRGNDCDELETRTNRFALQIYGAIRKSLNLNITVGVSAVHGGIVKELYTEAKKSMHAKFVTGANEVYFYSKNSAMKQEIQLPEEKFKLLRKYLQMGDAAGAKKILHEIIFSKSGKTAAEGYIFFVYINVLNTVLNSCEDAVLVLNDADCNYMSVDTLERFENNEQIEEFISTLIQRVCDMRDEFSEAGDCRELMEKVKLYIDRNYMNKISVSDLAKLFNINYNYFSVIFKEQVGVPITQYLRLVRIEKACTMLKNSDLNIDFIAASVGFADTMYFYRVFKRCKGMTPSEYRSKNTE